MANNEELCFRFTDKNYVTKQGFFAALGTSLVERLWDNVVNYRLKNSSRTNLRNVSQLPFTLTETPKLKERYSAFSSLLLSAKEEFEKFEALPEEKGRAYRGALYQSLRFASELEGVKVSEPTLHAFAGDYVSDDANQTALLGYRDFLKETAATAFLYCEDFFVALYSAFSGTSELTTFYRVNDSTVGQGRAGEYAKYNDIDSLITNLEDFVSSDPLFGLAKAFLAGFFVQYVQPFAEHNLLAAVSLTKRLLARVELGSFAYLLPIESAFVRNPKAIAAFEESAKTADFTYAMLYIIDTLTPLVESMLNDWTKIRLDAIRREYRGQPQEEHVEPVTPTLTEVKTEPVPTKVVEVPQTPKEEPVEVPVKPVIQEPPVVEETPKEPIQKEPVPEEKAPEEVPVLEALPPVDASAYAPRPSLSDKEVKMFARYIVETHPDISKQQALFYAAHHTPGRYYTIQDFKRTMKVAYETARTSMDRLAQTQLYRKLRIKNKYVYTPRTPGEKE